MSNENPAVIAVLLDAGADLKARAEEGWTPLHRAASFNKNPAPPSPHSWALGRGPQGAGQGWRNALGLRQGQRAAQDLRCLLAAERCPVLIRGETRPVPVAGLPYLPASRSATALLADALPAVRSGSFRRVRPTTAPPFSLVEQRSPLGSARSRPGREAAKRTLDGEDRFDTMKCEGKG